MDEMRELRFEFINRGAREERRDFFSLFLANLAVFAVNPFS
jgi:hypothetical protein